MRFIAGLFAALTLSTVGLVAQAQAPTEDITAIGCIRAWKPAEDVTRLPENREPGGAGMFLLTPMATSPTAAIDLPTYLLTPSGTANFQRHLDRKVEVVGVPQTAPEPPTVRAIATAPTPRPENRPNPQSFPRLTIRSIRQLADSCPG